MAAPPPVLPLAERSAPVVLPGAAVEELLALAAADPEALRAPELLLERRPEVPRTAAFAGALRADVLGAGGVARVDLAAMPAPYRPFAFAALGLAMAEPILRYGLLYEVADRGGSYLDQAIPVSMTRAATGLHTDSSAVDCVPGIVALLCERPSLDGGESWIVDASAACAALEAEAPHHAARLRRPFVRDVVTPGMDKGLDTLRRNRFPVLRTEPDFELRYMRYWIEKGHERLGRPLDPEDVAAFDALDAALARPEFGQRFRLAAGEAMFLDNRRCVHGRSAYDAVPSGGRLLWRMWLDERHAPEPAGAPARA